LLARAVEISLRAARATDGAVDPTVGRAMRAIGYDADGAAVASGSGPIPIRLERVPGWRQVHLDVGRRTLRVPAGVEIDLGSTGKALAADLAAEAAGTAAMPGGWLVNLGGDIAIAGAATAGGWRVLAADDARTAPDAGGEVIALQTGALATSSTTVRRWSRGEVELHHIIDPSTGEPARGPWRTVSVVAASCVDANAAATAAIVRGPDAVDWLGDLGLPARLVSTAGDVMRVAGWPTPHRRSRPSPGPVPGRTEVAT
jgi:thiamine biosynthesis lipoprotein